MWLAKDEKTFVWLRWNETRSIRVLRGNESRVMGPTTTWNMKMDTRGTQTDVVTDRHIADCLMELKSSAEFQDLNYRVSEHSG